MFYAIRTQPITDQIAEQQLCKFYTKKQRDNYVEFIGGKSISAKEADKLTPCGTSYTISNKELGCVYFVQRVMQ